MKTTSLAEPQPERASAKPISQTFRIRAPQASKGVGRRSRRGPNPPPLCPAATRRASLLAEAGGEGSEDARAKVRRKQDRSLCSTSRPRLGSGSASRRAA